MIERRGIVGTVIAAIVAIQRAGITFTLVFIWVCVAIAIHQLANPAIWITAVVRAIILALLLVFGRKKRKKLKITN